MSAMSFPIAPIVGQNQGKSNLPSFPKELADKLHARMSDKKTATNIMELRPELFKEPAEVEPIKTEVASPAKAKPNLARILDESSLYMPTRSVKFPKKSERPNGFDEAIEMISSKYQKDVTST
uniref:Uncharacterized protein n=1 Tax=Ditylenchus dipsaci TaxID=166011 RepID=A0A915EC07_9BILA